VDAPVSRWTAVVVIPARDEEERIGHCLEGVVRAAAAVRSDGVDVHVVVVADSCQDRTVTVARRHLRGGGEVMTIRAGSAGRARAAGVITALSRRRGPLDRVWLANTDADTVVPATWLRDQLRLADRGVVAVAGVVSVDSFAGHPPHVPVRWASFYEGPPDEPHPHIHGANLGVRADAYVTVGGWTPARLGEDQHLWRAIVRAGYRTASPRRLVVRTSGRSISRVRGGFADDLNALAGS
jgi:cellulose synthase/poly-beta-1,6-N-acetylglucosamine synthase-like glycosyltransferase